MVMPVVGVVDQGTEKVHDYVEGVEAAGGRAVVLCWRQRDCPEDDATAFDGLVLCGGDDVRGEYFGQPTHAKAVLDHADRDEYELAITRRAVRDGVPMLAICRGVQVLNIALGGDLRQHIPDVPGLSDHTQGNHALEIARGSLLERLSRSRGVNGHVVNTFHHQAIGRVAPGLRVGAVAPDGAIEALERDGPFCLGVQWHPERAGNSASLGAGLFDALIVAALAGG
jgi:putative glutamine amidotransferase